MAWQYWTPNDLAVLRRMYERGDSPGAIGKALGRSSASVSTKATKQGLKRPAKVPPHLQRAVDLQLAFDEAGIEGTPAELVARLLGASL